MPRESLMGLVTVVTADGMRLVRVLAVLWTGPLLHRTRQKQSMRARLPHLGASGWHLSTGAGASARSLSVAATSGRHDRRSPLHRTQQVPVLAEPAAISNGVYVAQEWVCTIKTRKDLYSEVEGAIKEVHSYEVPGILAVPIVAGSQSYFNWIDRETSSNEQVNQEKVTKEQLLQELSDAHERLISAATVAAKREVVRDGQKWGPREVMAHIAGWEAKAIETIPQIMAGEPLVAFDHDVFNATVITLLENQSFDAVRDILRQTYQRDIESLKRLDENVFVPGNWIHDRIKAAIRHINEHAEELEKLY